MNLHRYQVLGHGHIFWGPPFNNPRPSLLWGRSGSVWNKEGPPSLANSRSSPGVTLAKNELLGKDIGWFVELTRSQIQKNRQGVTKGGGRLGAQSRPLSPVRVPGQVLVPAPLPRLGVVSNCPFLPPETRPQARASPGLSLGHTRASRTVCLPSRPQPQSGRARQCAQAKINRHLLRRFTCALSRVSSFWKVFRNSPDCLRSPFASFLRGGV